MALTGFADPRACNAGVSCKCNWAAWRAASPEPSVFLIAVLVGRVAEDAASAVRQEDDWKGVCRVFASWRVISICGDCPVLQ